jgi:hypothetical protein
VFLSETVSNLLVICDTPVSSLSEGEAGRWLVNALHIYEQLYALKSSPQAISK